MSKLLFPKRVTIELTNRCNLACVFCHRTEVDMSLGNMSEVLYKKIIDEMAEHTPVAMVPFFRGESLLHPQFGQFMKYAKSKGIGPIQMTTNAFLLDEEKSRDVIESGIDFISFSLDTLDEEMYNSARINGNLRKSMDNVIRFTKLCEEYSRKGMSTPEVQISTVDTDDYRNGQEEFVDFWKKYSDYVRVYEEHDLYGRFRNRQISSVADSIKERRPCRKIYTDLVINWDGTISLCCYDWTEKNDLGDLNKDSIEAVWNSMIFQNLRRMHEEDAVTPDYLCFRCEYWKADYMDSGILGKKVIGERKILVEN